jgi:hypothetical protein
MKNENHISNSDLFRVLRLRANTRIRELQDACREATKANDRVCDLVFNEICAKGGNIRNIDGIRAEIQRICVYLRAPVPPPKGEWTQNVGAKVSDHKFTDTKADCPAPYGLRAGKESKKSKRGLRSDPGRVSRPGRKTV